MSQGQAYTNEDDLQVNELYCTFCTVERSSYGIGREYAF